LDKKFLGEAQNLKSEISYTQHLKDSQSSVPRLSLPWFIAKRYLQAQRKAGFLSFITLIAIIGVMMGTSALIITASILDGFEREIKEKVIDFSAHIQVEGTHNQLLKEYPLSIQRVQASVAGIKLMMPYVSKEGMVRSRDAVDGILLKGVDPSSEFLTPRHYLIRGSFLPAEKGSVHSIVIGKKLADKLNVDIGSNIAVFGLPRGGAMSQPRVKQFTITGIYESGMAEYDDIYAYTHLADAQDLFQTGDGITGYDILVTDIGQVDETARAVEDLLGYPHHARTVFQLYRNLFSWVDLQKQLSPLLLSLIIIVAVVNIIGTLLMFVLEKTKAIGILKSLGAGTTLIQRVFILQGLAIATIGIALGNILAFILCWIQLTFRLISLPSEIYYMNTVPVTLHPLNFIVVTMVTFFLCMLTTIIPSRSAAQLDPVTSMRFG
jgi:lipoprotein-releasing system permease protein